MINEYVIRLIKYIKTTSAQNKYVVDYYSLSFYMNNTNTSGGSV